MSLDHPMRYVVQAIAGWILVTAITTLAFAAGNALVQGWAIMLIGLVDTLLAYHIARRFVLQRVHFLWVLPSMIAGCGFAALASLLLASLIAAPDLFAVGGFASSGLGQNYLELVRSAGSAGIGGGIIASLCWLARKRPKRFGPGQCAACGYDLRGSLDARTCPECGKRLLPGFDLARKPRQSTTI